MNAKFKRNFTKLQLHYPSYKQYYTSANLFQKALLKTTALRLVITSARSKKKGIKDLMCLHSSFELRQLDLI